MVSGGWDRGEDLHLAAAAGALERVDREDASHQLRPGEATRARRRSASRVVPDLWARLWSAAQCGARRKPRRTAGLESRRSARFRCGGAVSGRSAGSVDRVGPVRGHRVGCARHHAISRAGAGPEDPMVADEVDSRRRHEGGELLHQLQGIEDDVAGSIAPAVLEAVEQPPVRETCEALGRHGRPRHGTAQPLEPTAIAGRHDDVRVETDTAHAGAALALERRKILSVDSVADAEHAASRARSRRHAARDRGGIETGEQRLLQADAATRKPCARRGPAPRSRAGRRTRAGSAERRAARAPTGARAPRGSRGRRDGRPCRPCAGRRTRGRNRGPCRSYPDLGIAPAIRS